MKRRIAILGSTGSIGTQALDVIGRNPDLFEVELLTANNSADSLICLAKEHTPNAVVIGNKEKYRQVKEELEPLGVKVFAGEESIAQAVEMDSIDMVLSAMVGYSGLIPTVNAIKKGKPIALANKETLVVAGELVMDLAHRFKVPIIPVDSEHSAIFQCLVGENNPIEKIILTASGGPFRGKSHNELQGVTLADALNHPNWCMGNKITIDSATMMNKGFEVIEAKWLFGLTPNQIEVVVHPQSIVHSLVQFTDGSIKAQLGLPDMRLPIQYALAFPKRLKSDFPRFSFSQCTNLTFEEPNVNNFPALPIAYEAMIRGGNIPCALNAANEVAVASFLANQIGFLAIAEIIRESIARVNFVAQPTLDDYRQTDSEARAIARSFLTKYQV